MNVNQNIEHTYVHTRMDTECGRKSFSFSVISSAVGITKHSNGHINFRCSRCYRTIGPTTIFSDSRFYTLSLFYCDGGGLSLLLSHSWMCCVVHPIQIDPIALFAWLSIFVSFFALFIVLTATVISLEYFRWDVLQFIHCSVNMDKNWRRVNINLSTYQQTHNNKREKNNLRTKFHFSITLYRSSSSSPFICCRSFSSYKRFISHISFCFANFFFSTTETNRFFSLNHVTN